MSSSDDDFRHDSSDSDYGSSRKRSKKKPLKKAAKKARTRSPTFKQPDGIVDCSFCGQKLSDNDNLRFHESPPEGAKDEFVALFDPSLSIDTGMEGVFDEEEDQRPEFRATQVHIRINRI